MAPSSDARVAVVTGVSRRAGIGFAIAQRLLSEGFRVLVHSWPAADRERGLADPGGTAGVLDELRRGGGDVVHIEADLADPATPKQVIAAAVEGLGGVDVLVVNHALGTTDTLESTTSELLDRAWAVNARAGVLLIQAFARAHDDTRPHGRVVLFTSGQHLEPMPDELAYAISKGAVHQMTATLADALAERGITVNAVNPGPVDTGWPSEELRRRIAGSFPRGRLGSPTDVANVVAWLCSSESAWITGQVIDAEGGFRRTCRRTDRSGDAPPRRRGATERRPDQAG